MPALAPSPRTYASHRVRQRRRILEAAEKLFDERGIDRVTMADITLAAGIRASTTYEYFSNKDEVVWAILGDLFTSSAVRAREAMESGETALARISALLEFMAGELANEPAKVRFVAQFDAMYSRHWPVERLLSLEAKVSPRGFQAFSDLIRDGIADGSLRPDLDPGLTMHAVMNAVIGAQRRLASLGSRVESEYGKSIDALFRRRSASSYLACAPPNQLYATEKPKRSQPKKKRPS